MSVVRDSAARLRSEQRGRNGRRDRPPDLQGHRPLSRRPDPASHRARLGHERLVRGQRGFEQPDRPEHPHRPAFGHDLDSVSLQPVLHARRNQGDRRHRAPADCGVSRLAPRMEAPQGSGHPVAGRRSSRFQRRRQLLHDLNRVLGRRREGRREQDAARRLRAGRRPPHRREAVARRNRFLRDQPGPHGRVGGRSGRDEGDQIHPDWEGRARIAGVTRHQVAVRLEPARGIDLGDRLCLEDSDRKVVDCRRRQPGHAAAEPRRDAAVGVWALQRHGLCL